MATKTLGTSTTSGLTAIPFTNSFGSSSPADTATIANDILDDLGNAHAIVPGAFDGFGRLFIPNRGILKVLPGDYVGVDANGWPILVSAYSIATGGWTHS